MSDASSPSADTAREHRLSGPVSAVGLIMMVVIVLAAACLGWVGLVVIVVVLALAYAVLLRWARWPQPGPKL
jgi:hypothetical protein